MIVEDCEGSKAILEHGSGQSQFDPVISSTEMSQKNNNQGQCEIHWHCSDGHCVMSI